jgi:hypothetical protein
MKKTTFEFAPDSCLDIENRINDSRVHHAENVENKGFCGMLINAATSELVTIRTVLLLNGGVYQKQLLFPMKTISVKQRCLLNRMR